jgi:hypothetical protein
VSDLPSSFDNEPQSTFADEKPELQPGEVALHNRSWIEIWQMAITRPSVATYEDILRDRVVTVGRGLTWVVLSFFLAIFVSVILQIILGESFTYGDNNSLGYDGDFGVLTLFCVPFVVAIALAIWIAIVGINHLVAQAMMQGSAKFDQVVFAMAAFTAPLTIINVIVGYIPVIGEIIYILVWIYAFALAVIALKAAHQFDWLKSIFSNSVLLGFGACCICGLVYSLLADPSNNAFQEFFDSLFTPTPFGQ